MSALQLAHWKARQEKEQGLAPGSLSPRKRDTPASGNGNSSAEETAAAVQQSLTFSSELAANAGSGAHQPPVVTADPELAELVQFEQYKIQRLKADDMKLSGSGGGSGSGSGSGSNGTRSGNRAAGATPAAPMDPRRTAAGMLAAPSSAGRRPARPDDNDPNSAGFI